MTKDAVLVPTTELVKPDIGPDHGSKEDKPTATVSTDIAYDNVLILPQTPQLIALMTYVWSGLVHVFLIFIGAFGWLVACVHAKLMSWLGPHLAE